MDFSWTEPQQASYARIAAFVKANLELPPCGGQRRQAFAKESWRLCGEAGLLGLCLSAEHGGLALDALTTARAVEAFGRQCRDMGLVFAASAHLFACAKPIDEFGAPALKAHALPKLASGDWVGANAITESEAGSDVYALRTSAVRDGDGYVLNGVKSFVTNGPVADITIVYARTDPDAGFLGISAFAVERETPGLAVGDPLHKMGLDSVPASSLHLHDCRVPAHHRLGLEGQGSLIFGRSMQWERTCLFAGYIGMMERQLEAGVEFAKQRRQFRKPIGKNQAVSHKLADMKLRLEAARLLLYRACWRLDRGEDAAVDIALAKLAVSEAAIQSSLNAIQLHGGAGYTAEAGFEQDLRDAVPATIFSGTSEIQRELIAEALGL